VSLRVARSNATVNGRVHEITGAAARFVPRGGCVLVAPSLVSDRISADEGRISCDRSPAESLGALSVRYSLRTGVTRPTPMPSMSQRWTW
jgi:hypothetical protein